MAQGEAIFILDTANIWLWGAFICFVLLMLALDLGVFNRKASVITLREAFTWSAVWIGLALAFNLGVWHWFGAEKGLQFLTGYLVEKALSVDNLFVFLLIFGYFRVAEEHQHRVLFWGVVGALVMRAVFIIAGTALLDRFHWLIYIFGGLLLVTGVKMLRRKEEDVHPERNPILRLAQKVLPTVSEYHDSRMTVVKNGRRYATPLLLVLIAVEVTDLVFALDSIPAIFAISRDPFIVFTSNIFAMLGLRSLYFLLVGFMHRFHYLKVGLALVLIFVGTKMSISELYKLPVAASLGVIALLIGGSIVWSLWSINRKVKDGSGVLQEPPRKASWI